jgi:hypothetical protein
MTEWSDRKKWWMDLLKTTRGAFLAVALTILIISSVEERRRKEAFVWQADLNLRIAAIQDFSSAANLYRFGAYDAARDYLQNIPLNNSDAVHKWNTEQYPRLMLAKRHVEQLFATRDQALLSKFCVQMESVFNAVNGAPLFPVGRFPKPCYDRAAVDEEWRHWRAENTMPPLPNPLTRTQASEVWKKFTSQCFTSVLTSYDQAADAVVADLRLRLTHDSSRP